MLRRRTQNALLLVLGVLVAISVPLLAASPAPTPEASRPEPAADGAREVLFDESFSVRSGGTLRLDLGSEDVDVRTVRGERARVTVEGWGRDARREFERRRFSARTQGRDLLVRTDPPRGSWSRGRTDARFEVTVEVPRRYSADLDLGSGNVEVASLEGDVRVDAGSGDLQIGDVTGDVFLDTGSGGVRAGRLRGPVEVDTGSGRVEIDRVEGRFSADTGSGGIAVGRIDGPADLSAGSGRIDVGIGRSATRIDAGSGTVVVRVPRGAGFDVDLEGGSVQIDRALRFDGRSDRDEARGRIGRGGPELTVSTGSGSIRLEAD